MKKNLMIAGILILVGILVACNTRPQMPSGRPAGDANAGGPAENTGGNAQSVGLPIESKVGIGILKLEGTDQAIDETTAKELLPLFKALKTLSTDNNTAVAEISALNTQIKNTLTAEQLTSIEKMEISMTDLRTLTESYGVSATNSSSTGSNSSRNQGMGGPGGMPGGGMMGGLMNAGGNSSSTQATPNAVAAMTDSRKSAGGYNLTFADAIIKLLQSKITD